MLPIRPLHNKIFFQFEESIVKNKTGTRGFESVSAAGIVVMANDEDAAKTGRWAKVLSVGPNVSEVKAGDRICIHPLRWTSMMTVDSVNFWQTNDDEVLLIQD